MFCNIPLLTWILLGFLTTFFVFFVIPIFLGPSLTMKFNQYILVLTPIGFDFRGIVSYSYTWFRSGVVPLIIYPPLTLIFFVPFTFVHYETGYEILIGIILICYLSTTLNFSSMAKSREGYFRLCNAHNGHRAAFLRLSI